MVGSDIVGGYDKPGSIGTFYAAALESGLDNGIAFMDLDEVTDFYNVMKRIKQYDVSASSLFIAECEALITLAALVNRSDVVPTLRARASAMAAAMDETMWNDADRVYESNRLPKK